MSKFKLLDSTEFNIVIFLYKNNGEMSSFNIFRQSKINFSDFIRVIKNLERKKIIKVSEKIVILERLGYEIIYTNQKTRRKKGLDRIPKKMCEDYILPIGAPYIPKLSAVKSLLLNMI